MREQLKRILGLVKDGRLSHDDAVTLLAALNPKLVFKDETMLQLFGLLNAEEFGTERVADLMMHRAEPHRAEPPAPPRPPEANWGGPGLGFSMENLGGFINTAVDEAMSAVRGTSARSPRPGTILSIQSENEDGATFSANLPLSLAAHAERLIPPHAQKSLAKSGLSMEALKLLLQAGPPPGPLLQAEDEDGNSVRLDIK
jgi:hypothetical protein